MLFRYIKIVKMCPMADFGALSAYFLVKYMYSSIDSLRVGRYWKLLILASLKEIIRQSV